MAYNPQAFGNNLDERILKISWLPLTDSANRKKFVGLKRNRTIRSGTGIEKPESLDKSAKICIIEHAL
jgi:hypothetical protein